MKKSAKILSCLLAFLLMFSGCSPSPVEDSSSSATESSSSQAETSEPVILDVAFTFDQEGKSVGTEQMLKDQYENYAFGVCYPSFDNETVDQQIRLKAREWITDFQKQVSDFSARRYGRRASLKVDYEDCSVGDHVVSLVLNAQIDIPGSSSISQKTQTMLFDLNRNKQLCFDDIFQEDAKETVFQKVVAHYPSDDSRLAIDSDRFSKLYGSSDQAVSNFILSGDEVIFYYDNPFLFTSQSGQLAISVPISELDDEMKVDKNGNKKSPPKPPEPQSDPQPEQDLPPATPPSNPQPQSGTIDPSKPMVALTFDDGPSRVTPKILDLLEQYHARATFFVVGTQIGANYQSMQRAVSLGCEIGSHTSSHASLPGLDLDGLASEIGKNNQRISDYISYSPTLLRPPYGATNDTVRANAGMPLILWNIDTEDWKSRNANSVINRALNKVKDGDIILMHDLYQSTAEACETIIPELINRGFQLVTVSEMAQAKGVILENGKLYYNLK